MDKLLKSVLNRITPKEKERHKTQSFIQNVMRISESILKKEKLKQILTGSYMRDTWMKDKKEFDLFIIFPENTTREDLEKRGIEVGKKIVASMKGKYKIAYAEHPYIRSEIGGYQIDIVPCYDIKSPQKIKSAVDRTPFHNRWLSKNLDKKLIGDVRLFKQFVKSIGIYGSDTKTSGLSGYLCELLVINYGSFKGLIEAVSKWTPHVFVDIVEKRTYKSLDNELKKRFSRQPLILIDPVDKNRNVAAAFSYENFTDLVYSTRSFIKKPTSSYFSIVKSNPNITQLSKKISKRESFVYGISFNRPDVIDDVLWPQLRKTSKRIANIMKEVEFEVMNFDAFADDKNCIILLEFSVEKMPNIRKLRGPPVSIIDRSDEFINKYRSSRLWVEDEYWFAEVNRKFTHAKDKLKHSLSSSKSNLLEKGIGSYIAASISKKYSIISKNNIVAKARKNRDFAIFIKRFFEKSII